MYNPFSLEGKTILITGASSGIGAETAVECSRLGATLIITGRDEQRLNKTYSRLDSASTQKHILIPADLTKDNDVVRLVEHINGIDGLVSNAGVNRIKPIAFIQEDDYDFVFRNNYYTALYLIRLLLKKKRLNKQSSIVFTSSVSAFFNAPGRALYACSKAALTSLMRSIAVELSEKGIRANAVHPGLVETRLIQDSLSDEERDSALSSYPLKRFGRPEEVAWAIIYLLSDASSWVTGTSMIVDGGFMLR